VSAFREKAKSGEAWVSGGIYFCEPSLASAIPQDRPSNLETDIFPALVEAGEAVFALRCKGRLFDIGTPAGLDEAQRGWEGNDPKKSAKQ